MSIRKRVTPDGIRWDALWREGEKQRSKTFTRKRDALAEDARQKERKRMGAHAPAEPSSRTLENWATEWVTEYGPSWAATTRKQRAQDMDKWVLPYIGHIPLRDLGIERLMEWRGDIRKRGASDKTVNRVIPVLSACLGVATSRGLLPANPMEGVPRLDVTGVVERIPLEDEVVQALLDAMPSPRDRLRVALMGFAGLRPAEASGLQVRDIRERITVARSVQYGEVKSTKTSGVRTVPVYDAMATELDRARGDGLLAGAPTSWATPGTRGGPLNHRNWERRVWRPIAAEVADGAVPYSLRHTFARYLLADEGLDVPLAAAYMGHSPRTLLANYSHLRH